MKIPLTAGLLSELSDRSVNQLYDTGRDRRYKGEQNQHDQQQNIERNGFFDKRFGFASRDGAGYEHQGAHGRRQSADRIVENVDHGELDFVDAEFGGHRSQQRNRSQQWDRNRQWNRNRQRD